MLLKILSRNEIDEIIDSVVAKNLINGVIILLKQKSNIKILGIKIGSFLQHLSNSALFKELQVLKKEMLRCMCCEDNREIRKLAIMNIQMNDENFDELIMRTREVDSNLRLTIFTKLIKEKISLESKDLSSIYKIVYDGLHSRDEIIRKECVTYLKLNYNRFQETNKKSQILENLIESSEIKKKRYLSPKKLGMINETKNQIITFFRLFQIENTLFYPNLYQMLELMTKEFLNNIVNLEEFSFYLRDFLIYDLQFQKKNENDEIIITNEEIFLLRYLASLYQEGTESHKELEELFMIIDECFPNGCIFVDVITNFHKNNNLFGLHQSLLLSEMLINCDETGRSKLMDVLKGICFDLKKIELPFPTFKETAKRNDLYYELQPEKLNNLVFSQSHFETPIIRDLEDLIPIIIKIFRKLIGDDNNMFSIQIIQLISEIREPLENDVEVMENEENLQNKLQRNKKQLGTINVKLEEINEKVKETKKNKTKKNECDDLLNKKEYLVNQKDELQKNCEDLADTIDSMNVRCLQIALGLLQRCRLTLKDPGLTNLLTSFIGPLFKSDNKEINDKALQCLALYVFLDRKLSLEYFAVFTNFFESEIKPNELESSHIVSVKVLFDFFMVYEYPKQPADYNLTYDMEDIMNNLNKFMFKADVLMQRLCIDGFCRLLFNDKIEDTDRILSNLMIIWNNSFLVKNGGFEAVQILSTFFRNYIANSLIHLENFERALETVINLCLFMLLKQYEFNNEYIFYDFVEMTSLFSIMKIGISLMTYAHNQDFVNLKEFKESSDSTLFFPQEKFFIYVCKSLSAKSNTRISALFEKIFIYFDFFNHIKNKTQALILRNYVEKVFEKNMEFENNKFLNKVMKKMEVCEQQTEEKNEQNEQKEPIEPESDKIKAFIIEIETNLKDRKAQISRYFKNLLDDDLLMKRVEGGVVQGIPMDENSAGGSSGLMLSFEGMEIVNEEVEEEKEQNKENEVLEGKIKNGRTKKTKDVKRKVEDLEGDVLPVKRMKRTKRK